MECENFRTYRQGQAIYLIVLESRSSFLLSLVFVLMLPCAANLFIDYFMVPLSRLGFGVGRIPCHIVGLLLAQRRRRWANIKPTLFPPSRVSRGLAAERMPDTIAEV